MFRNVFPFVVKLNNEVSDYFYLETPTPHVVIIGDDKNGKTTLLEKLTGISNVLNTSDRPIRISFRTRTTRGFYKNKKLCDDFDYTTTKDEYVIEYGYSGCPNVDFVEVPMCWLERYKNNITQDSIVILAYSPLNPAPTNCLSLLFINRYKIKNAVMVVTGDMHERSGVLPDLTGYKLDSRESVVEFYNYLESIVIKNIKEHTVKVLESKVEKVNRQILDNIHNIEVKFSSDFREELERLRVKVKTINGIIEKIK